MKSTETMNLSGYLKIYGLYLNGACKLFYDKKNILTLARKQFLLSGIYTPSVTSDPIDRLRVGTGGTIDVEGLFPKLEDQTQTNLNTPLITVSASNVLDNSVPLVTFLADLDAGQGNGSLITEAGLITVAGNLFNLKNFPGIPKTSDFSLHFEWTIKFA